MAKLILIRHGETATNASGRIHNTKDNQNLNKKGIKQIIKTADKLKSLGVNKLFSSTETRALESVKLLSKVLEINYLTVDGLEERNWGEFGGRSWDEIKNHLDQLSLEERFIYEPANGESWQNFEKRLINVVKNLVKENSNDVIAIVTHGGVIRALLPFLLSESKDLSFKYDPSNASISIFEIAGDGYKSISINDTSHLI